MLANNSQSHKSEVLSFNSDTVYQSIMAFLNDGLSESTKRSYLKTYEDFFKFVCKVDLANVTEQMLIDIKNEDVKRFRSSLERKYSNSSINQKMRSISSLFQSLAIDRDDLNPSKVNLRSKREEKNHYGMFTQSEIDQILQYFKERDIEKYLLVKLAIKTSYRQAYLLSLRWRDITKHSEEYYIIKGKQDSSKAEEDKTIEAELMEELEQLRGDRKRSDTIFQISTRTASRMIKDVVEDLGLDPENSRNLVFHSIKAVSAATVWDKTRDIRMVQKQLNHKDVSTSLNFYHRLQDDPLKNPSLLVDKKLDDSIIEKATHEHLLKAIIGSDDFIKAAIISKLKEMEK